MEPAAKGLLFLLAKAAIQTFLLPFAQFKPYYRLFLPSTLTSFLKRENKLMRFSNRNKIIFPPFIQLRVEVDVKIFNVKELFSFHPRTVESSEEKIILLWKRRTNKNYELVFFFRLNFFATKLITKCLIYAFPLSLRFISGLSYYIKHLGFMVISSSYYFLC